MITTKQPRINDLVLGREPQPPSTTVIYGKNLTNTIRPSGIPFGRVYEWGKQGKANYAKIPVGILIYESDQERFNAVLVKRDKRKAADKARKPRVK